MLLPAMSKRDEIIKKFSQEIYSKKYFWYSGYAYSHELPKIKDEDYYFQYAIVNKNDEVVGYLSYRVDPYTDSVLQFGLYSFSKGDITVGIDVNNKMNELVNRYRRIEWRVVGGNKVQKIYDKFCKKHGGQIHEFRDAVRDENGNYHNSYVYEILKEKK